MELNVSLFSKSRYGVPEQSVRSKDSDKILTEGKMESKVGLNNQTANGVEPSDEPTTKYNNFFPDVKFPTPLDKKTDIPPDNQTPLGKKVDDIAIIQLYIAPKQARSRKINMALKIKNFIKDITPDSVKST